MEHFTGRLYKWALARCSFGQKDLKRDKNYSACRPAALCATLTFGRLGNMES